MEITRLEFDDSDDPESSINSQPGSPIRLTFSPGVMVIALPNGKGLTQEDQVVMGEILRMVYEQGKRVGRLVKDQE